MMKAVITVIAFIALIITWALSGPLTAAVLSIGLLFLVFVAWFLFGRKSQTIVLCHTKKKDQKIEHQKTQDNDVINRILQTSDLSCPPPPITCTDGNYGSDEWDAGYKIPSEYCATEKYMQELATNVVEAAAARAPTRVLPDQCCTEPIICPMETTWQAAFAGCPTTYIKGPLACDLYQKDPRAWTFDLNKAIQERATQNDMIWDPYKHMAARQKFAQFIMNDVVNQKASYERPIEQLEESYCFARKVNGVVPGEYSNGVRPEIPPVY